MDTDESQSSATKQLPRFLIKKMEMEQFKTKEKLSVKKFNEHMQQKLLLELQQQEELEARKREYVQLPVFKERIRNPLKEFQKNYDEEYAMKLNERIKSSLDVQKKSQKKFRNLMIYNKSRRKLDQDMNSSMKKYSTHNSICSSCKGKSKQRQILRNAFIKKFLEIAKQIGMQITREQIIDQLRGKKIPKKEVDLTDSSDFSIDNEKADNNNLASLDSTSLIWKKLKKNRENFQSVQASMQARSRSPSRISSTLLKQEYQWVLPNIRIKHQEKLFPIVDDLNYEVRPIIKPKKYVNKSEEGIIKKKNNEFFQALNTQQLVNSRQKFDLSNVIEKYKRKNFYNSSKKEKEDHDDIYYGGRGATTSYTNKIFSNLLKK